MAPKSQSLKRQKLLSDLPAQKHSQLSFLDLPPEVRQMCYDLVDPRDIPQVIRLNKQIYSETHCLLATRCTFDITCKPVAGMRDLANKYQHALHCIRQLPAKTQSLSKIHLQVPCVLKSAQRSTTLDAFAGFERIIEALTKKELSLSDLTIFYCLPDSLNPPFTSTRYSHPKLLARLKLSLNLRPKLCKHINLVLCYGKEGVPDLSNGGTHTSYVLLCLLNSEAAIDTLRMRFPTRGEWRLPLTVDNLRDSSPPFSQPDWLARLRRIHGLQSVITEYYDEKERRSFSSQERLAPQTIEGLQTYLGLD